jgi:hypothetical protein
MRSLHIYDRYGNPHIRHRRCDSLQEGPPQQQARHHPSLLNGVAKKKKCYTANEVLKKKCYTALKGLRRNEPLAREGCNREEQGAVTSPTPKGWNGTNVLKLTIAHPPQRRMRLQEEEAVTPCTRDYVATNGWLLKGCNRLTSGTARNPCFKKAQDARSACPQR